MDIQLFQECIKETYIEKDSKRGIQGTFLWFTEEVGELARAIRKGNHEQKEEEFSDVFAWLASLANLCNINMNKVSRKYAAGCPKCKAKRCECNE